MPPDRAGTRQIRKQEPGAADGRTSRAEGAPTRPPAGLGPVPPRSGLRAARARRLFTYERVVQKVLERVSALDERSTTLRLPIRDLVAEGLAPWLPVDPGRRPAHRVTPALVGRTVDDPRLAQSNAEPGRLIRARLAAFPGPCRQYA